MSKSETNLHLKRLVQGALVEVCQAHFNYIDFVHVTGRLVFNVDNREVGRSFCFLVILSLTYSSEHHRQYTKLLTSVLEYCPVRGKAIICVPVYINPGSISID